MYVTLNKPQKVSRRPFVNFTVTSGEHYGREKSQCPLNSSPQGNINGNLNPHLKDNLNTNANPKITSRWITLGFSGTSTKIMHLVMSGRQWTSTEFQVGEIHLKLHD